MDWYNLLKDLGIFGLIIGASTLIIRKYIEVSFSKDLERYRAELTKEAISFKTTFENLHAQRAVIIRTLYEKIVNSRDAFESLINPIQLAGELPEAEKKKRAGESFNELLYFFQTNKIYFQQDLSNQLDKLAGNFKDIWHDFNKPHVQPDGAASHDIEAWVRAWRKLRADEIPPLLSKIEQEFRNLLGIK